MMLLFVVMVSVLGRMMVRVMRWAVIMVITAAVMFMMVRRMMVLPQQRFEQLL